MPNFLTTILVLMGTVLGVTVAFSLQIQYRDIVHEAIDFADPRMVLGLLFGGIGYLVASTMAWEFQRWFEKKLPKIRISDFLWGAGGFAIGLVIANLAMIPILSLILNNYMTNLISGSKVLGVVLPVAVIIVPLTLNVCCGYIGMTVFLRKQSELVGLFASRFKAEALAGDDLKILDTSVIIDGRIADLLSTSILEGRLSVPLFVLNELQLISDSSDPSKRARGKRGFEILELLKKNEHIKLEFPEVDFHDIPHVDNKLIHFAKETGGKIVTNDFALNKLAKLQEISVVNINEVSNALRPVILAGEKIEIKIIKRGKGQKQGIGYLNDGTMVVVEDGADHIGENCTVKVSNIQQSSVGRMVFATIDSVEAV